MPVARALSRLCAGWIGAAALLTAGAGAQEKVVSLAPAPYAPAGPQTEAARPSDLVGSAVLLPPEAVRDLGPLTQAERGRLASQDRAAPATLRQKVGIVRRIEGGLGFSGVLSAPPEGVRPLGGGLLVRSADGRLAWMAALASRQALALRLHVTQASLPAGSRLYVATPRGEIQGPYSLGGVGPFGLWTGSVDGDTVFLELQVPAAAGPSAPMRFEVEEVGHIAFGEPTARPEASASPADNPCFVDASCVDSSEYPAVDLARRAVAQLLFQEGADFYICTGTLINATPAPALPFLLTANHCVSTSAAAASLEARFSYVTASCGGAPPDFSKAPRTLGATLVATTTLSDATLLHLWQQPPAGAALLGWTTADFSTDTTTKFFRISHPFDASLPSRIAPQTYSRHFVPFRPLICLNPAAFLHSSTDKGGTGPGSSGSALCLGDGRIVGQLFGYCTGQQQPCDSGQRADGSFRATFQAFEPFLTGGPDVCAPDPQTLCLSGGRFRVTAAWRTSTQSGQGQAVSLTSDTGYFWFFNAANVEMIVKVLDACSLNGRFWVFGGGLTDVEVTMTVSDTRSGAQKTYVNPLSTAFQPVQDTSAFATCP